MLVVIWLSWLSGRALAAQARDVLGSNPVAADLLYFHLITSKFILFPVCGKVENTTQHGFFPDGENFLVTPNGVLWHILSGCQVCD